MALQVTSCKQQQHRHLLMMEVKVLSARCLKGPSSILSGRRLRPYVALSVASATSDVMRDPVVDGPPPLPAAARGNHALYRTRVDEHGGENPTWGDTVRLPLDPSFLRRPAPGGDSTTTTTPLVHLLVLSKRRLGGPARVGWCRIPACDVVDGLRPSCAMRRLSYALRSCRHGGRGRGVVDVAVRLVEPAAPPVLVPPATAPAVVPAGWEVPRVRVLGVPPPPGWVGDVAIGVPMQAFRPAPDAAVGTGRKLKGRGLTWR